MAAERGVTIEFRGVLGRQCVFVDTPRNMSSSEAHAIAANFTGVFPHIYAVIISTSGYVHLFRSARKLAEETQGSFDSPGAQGEEVEA